MRKLIVFICLIFTFVINTIQSNAITYTEAKQSNKAIAMMIYADWADDVQAVQQTFTLMQKKYGDKYNFVYLNIADKDTKEFNKTFNIYPNLPYILLFREGGKFSRYLQKSCATSTSCADEKFKFFVN